MLILARKIGETFYIGDDVKITVLDVKGNQVRVGIDAPKDVKIMREELIRRDREYGNRYIGRLNRKRS